jgi:MFS transporter, DHA1 family, tetracycline resistance protein
LEIRRIMKKGSLLVLFLVVFIDLLGFGIVLPLLPFYASEYGASGTTVGLVVGVYSLMQFFFAPIWGRLSDRVGRRPILILSLTGSVIGYLIFATAQSIPVLMISRLLAGIAAANISTAQAYITDITTSENRAKGMGIIGAAFGLGFIFGPVTGGVLSTYGTTIGLPGNLLPGLAASALSLGALIVAFFLLGESRPADLEVRRGRPPQFDPAVWRRMGSDGSLARVLVSLFLVVLAFAAMETSVVLHGEARYGFTPRDLGFFFGVMGALVAVIQGGLIGRLSKRFGERVLTRSGGLLLAAGFAAVPFIDRPVWLYGAAVLIAAGQGISYPSLTSMISKFADASERGSTLGISAALSSLARMTGPVIAGVLYDIFGAGGPFLTAAALTITVSAIMVAHLREAVGEASPGGGVTAAIEPPESVIGSR